MAEDFIYSKHLFYQNIKKRRPRQTPRELAILGIAAIILIAAPWAWGGVVWWATLVTLGLSLGMLLIAVGNFRTQAAFSVIWLVVLGIIGVMYQRGVISGLDQTLNYVALPTAALFTQIIGASLLYDDIKSQSATESLQNLKRLIPFWLGLILFSYFAIQDFNAWGSVTERDMFWKIYREPNISWLPSGLRAPFISEARDPGGMNAWRLILTFAGPWMFFCALQVGLTHRRSYIALSWIAIISASIFGIWAFNNQYSDGMILGYLIPNGTQTFGTFIDRTHAGTFFYLNLALAMALAFWHFRKNENSSVKGSPHLIAIFFAAVLVVLGVCSYSVGVILILILSLLLILPLTFFLGMPLKIDTKFGPNISLLIMILALVFGLATTINYKNLERKINDKLARVVVKKEDDRAPYRNATLAMISADGVKGKIWYGWGAGSYRWVSPYYQAKQKELTDKDGHLIYRATYAHNDWLQMLAEWGVVGVIPIFFAGLWFLNLGTKCFQRGRPELIPLFLIIIFLGIHATVDLLLWFTPLLFIMAFIVSMIKLLTEDPVKVR